MAVNTTNLFILIAFFCISCKSTSSSHTEIIKHAHLIHILKDDRSVGGGTCFIVEERGKYFLVTNYHIMSGRHPLTGALLTKDTVKNVAVVFRVTDKIDSFYMIKYPVLDSLTKTENFKYRRYPKHRGIIDVAIMPIAVPDNVRNAFVSNEVMDTTIIDEGTPLSIFGFPDGKFVEGWRPSEATVQSVMSNSKKWEILVDGNSLNGFSGSPIYRRKGNGYKMVGIYSVSMQKIRDDRYIEGGGVPINLLIEIFIEELIFDRPAIEGVKFQFK